MSNAEKPREWWIYEKSRFEAIAESEPGPGRFHVIEKSAYDAVVKERDELQSKYDFRGRMIMGMEKLGEKETEERDALVAQLAEACAARDQWRVAHLKAERLERALAYAKTCVFTPDLDEIERLERGK